MPWAPVEPVMLECSPGSLCAKRYPGHKRGCPNYGKRATCPPQAAIWTPEGWAGREVFAIWNAFPFGQHVERMRTKHPDWSQRQLACCLYWQGTARKQLGHEIEAFRGLCRGQVPISRIPEAHGVNVTKTMARLGILLEWPPRIATYQVALAIVPRFLGPDASSYHHS